MTATQQLLTPEEFFKQYEGAGPEKFELWDGEVRAMAPVGHEHGRAVIEIGGALALFVKQHRLGSITTEVGFVLQSDPAIVLAPDLAFLEAARVPLPADEGLFIQGPPALAIEVTSPSDSDTAVHRKVQLYLRHGVPRVWVVRPTNQSVTVHRPDGTARELGPADRLASDDAGFSFDGFALPLVEIFPSR